MRKNHAERNDRIDLSGVKLGAVLAIDELKMNNNGYFYYCDMLPKTMTKKRKRRSCCRNDVRRTSIAVKLRVRFALEPVAAVGESAPADRSRSQRWRPGK